MAKSINKLLLSTDARSLLSDRYLVKKDGNLETPEKLVLRVARHIAFAEVLLGSGRQAEMEASFAEIMLMREFLPNTPTLMNAGTPMGQLAACFVLPIVDSLESIFTTLKNASLIQQSGGGCGYDFSALRPRGDEVRSSQGVSSGPLPFMMAFDAAANAINQGGRRRGANMGVLRGDHPDIESFITAKSKDGQIQNFNLSVGITDAFMTAIVRGERSNLINPHTKQVVKKVKAQDLFNKIVLEAWRTGEPGLLFLDAINRANPTPHLGPIKATNPCGEVPLLAYECCNLGSINLALMVKCNGHFNGMDYGRLAGIVRLAVRFLDDVIEVNRYPLPQIKRMALANRKIGLGVMGFADLLAKLGISYDSKRALDLADELMGFIAREARAASFELAKERGPFPNFSKSVFVRQGLPPLRNATLTTIAPTGALSQIAGCSSSIEPVFAPVQTRLQPDGQRSIQVHQALSDWLSREGHNQPEIISEITLARSVRKIKSIPMEIQKVFSYAHEISPEWHVLMQAAFQRHVDNAVSKTVNLPSDASIEDVQDVFMLAHQVGCKGITVYRDGSRAGQVIESGSKSSLPIARVNCPECYQFEGGQTS